MRSGNIETNRSKPAGVSRFRRAILFQLTAASVLCWVASAARAATIYEAATVKFAAQGPSDQSSLAVTLLNGSNPPLTVNLNEGGAMDWTNLAKTDTGPYNFSFVGDSTYSASNEFISFCIELTQDISIGQKYNINVIDLPSAPIPSSGPIGSGGMGTNAAGLIEQLWTDHFSDIFNPNTTLGQTVNGNAAAFQLAIWKLEYDGGSIHFDNNGHLTNIGFDTGYLQVGDGDKDTDDTNALNSATAKLATQWLQSIRPGDAMAPLLAITGNPDGTNFQDQVVELTPGITPPPGSVVPEPSSLVLCAIGVVGMAAAKRRRGRRSGQ